MKRSKSIEPRNRLLKALPPVEMKALGPDLSRVSLARNTVLFSSGLPVDTVYFPEDCVISFLGNTGDGGNIEIRSAGPEGLAGISAVLGPSNPFQGVVQVSGSALLIRRSALLKHFRRGLALHDRILHSESRSDPIFSRYDPDPFTTGIAGGCVRVLPPDQATVRCGLRTYE